MNGSGSSGQGFPSPFAPAFGVAPSSSPLVRQQSAPASFGAAPTISPFGTTTFQFPTATNPAPGNIFGTGGISGFGTAASATGPFALGGKANAIATTQKGFSPAAAPTPVTPGEIVSDSRRSVSKRYSVIYPTTGLAIRESELFVSKKVGMLAFGDEIESSEECDILITSGSLKMPFTVVKLNDGSGWVSKCSKTTTFLEEPHVMNDCY